MFHFLFYLFLFLFYSSNCDTQCYLMFPSDALPPMRHPPFFLVPPASWVVRGGEGWWGLVRGAWLAVLAAKYGGNAHSVQGETKQLMLRKLKTFSLKWSRSWRNDFAWDCHHWLIGGVIFSFQLGRFLYTFLFLRRTGMCQNTQWRV